MALIYKFLQFSTFNLRLSGIFWIACNLHYLYKVKSKKNRIDQDHKAYSKMEL